MTHTSKDIDPRAPEFEGQDLYGVTLGVDPLLDPDFDKQPSRLRCAFAIYGDHALEMETLEAEAFAHVYGRAI